MCATCVHAWGAVYAALIRPHSSTQLARSRFTASSTICTTIGVNRRDWLQVSRACWRRRGRGGRGGGGGAPGQVAPSPPATVRDLVEKSSERRAWHLQRLLPDRSLFDADALLLETQSFAPSGEQAVESGAT